MQILTITYGGMPILGLRTMYNGNNTLRHERSQNIYIYGIGIFSNDWDTHMNSVHIVLDKLQKNGSTVNPLKCKWAVQETDWPGYWLTPTGLKPWSKMIQAIVSWERPKTVKQV